MGLLKEIKKINNLIKKSVASNNQNMSQKLEEMKRISELDGVKENEELYNNIDIVLEYRENNITESEYNLQMKKHKERIDKLLSSLNHNNITYEDLYNLRCSE